MVSGSPIGIIAKGYFSQQDIGPNLTLGVIVVGVYLGMIQKCQQFLLMHQEPIAYTHQRLLLGRGELKVLEIGFKISFALLELFFGYLTPAVLLGQVFGLMNPGLKIFQIPLYEGIVSPNLEHFLDFSQKMDQAALDRFSFIAVVNPQKIHNQGSLKSLSQ